MTHEYHEGPAVLERFKKMMTQVFQAPKSSTPFAKPKAINKAVSKAVRKKRVPQRESEDDAG